MLSWIFCALRLGGVLTSPQAAPSGLQMTPPSHSGMENPRKPGSPDFILIIFLEHLIGVSHAVDTRAELTRVLCHSVSCTAILISEFANHEIRPDTGQGALWLKMGTLIFIRSLCGYFVCLCGAVRIIMSVWTWLIHWVLCSGPACVIVGRHIGSGAARWLPWEPSNIPRQIPEMSIKRTLGYFTFDIYGLTYLLLSPPRRMGTRSLWSMIILMLT